MHYPKLTPHRLFAINIQNHQLKMTSALVEHKTPAKTTQEAIFSYILHCLRSQSHASESKN